MGLKQFTKSGYAKRNVERLAHTLEVLWIIVLDALFFVCCVGTDFLLSKWLNSLQLDGVHQTIAHWFRVLFSISIFSIASLHLMKDVAAAFFSLRAVLATLRTDQLVPDLAVKDDDQDPEVVAAETT